MACFQSRVQPPAAVRWERAGGASGARTQDQAPEVLVTFAASKGLHTHSGCGPVRQELCSVLCVQTADKVSLMLTLARQAGAGSLGPCMHAARMLVPVSPSYWAPAPATHGKETRLLRRMVRAGAWVWYQSLRKRVYSASNLGAPGGGWVPAGSYKKGQPDLRSSAANRPDWMTEDNRQLSI